MNVFLKNNSYSIFHVRNTHESAVVESGIGHWQAQVVAGQSVIIHKPFF